MIGRAINLTTKSHDNPNHQGRGPPGVCDGLGVATLEVLYFAGLPQVYPPVPPPINACLGYILPFLLRLVPASGISAGYLVSSGGP
eukprot:2687266-Pyramimonas_sp.AAC.1